MGSVFARAGGRGRRGVEVRLGPASRETLADLLVRVHELLEDPHVGTEPIDRPIDPLEELTGLDASAFDTSGMGEPFGEADGDDRGDRSGSPRAPFFAPDDPAVARLLPDANREDPALAEEFRRLTEHGLRRRKQEALALAAAALRRPDHPVVLSMAEAQALAKGLTDVRLVLAERLGVRTDEDAQALGRLAAAGLHEASAGGEQDEAEPWFGAVILYEELTGLQEDLVRALMR